MSLNGIDISNHQAGLDLAKVPCDFVICKATEGTTFVDKYCDGFVQKAIALGKPFGVYHFASGKSSGRQEAEFFYNNIKGYVGKGILVLDWEGSAVNRGVSYAKEFLDRLYELTGVKALFYSYNNCVNSYDWSPLVKGDYGLWNAGYYAGYQAMGYNPNAPLKGGTGAWPGAAMYQYTSSGRLSGYSGNLDLDVFYGDKNAWAAYSKGKAVSSDPDGEIRSGGTTQKAKDETGKVNYQVHTRENGWMNWRCDGDMAGTTGQNRRIEALRLDGPGNPTVKVHLMNDGDKEYKNVKKDTVLGTTGEGKRMEALAISSEEIPYAYRVHQKTYGWSKWGVNGEMVGKTGESKQLEALEIKIPELILQAHVQTKGWLDPVPDGEIVGTTGNNLQLEAFKIDPLGKKIEVQVHMQELGWEDYGEITKDTVIGTTNENRRLECLRFKGPFEWRAHIEESGWTDWTEADGVSTLGTVGQALQMEAFQIRML